MPATLLWRSTPVLQQPPTFFPHGAFVCTTSICGPERGPSRLKLLFSQTSPNCCSMFFRPKRSQCLLVMSLVLILKDDVTPLAVDKDEIVRKDQ